MITRTEYNAETRNSYFEPPIPENYGFCEFKTLKCYKSQMESVHYMLCIVEEMFINGSFIATLDRSLLRILASERSDVNKMIVEDGAVTVEPQSVFLSTMQFTRLLLQIFRLYRPAILIKYNPKQLHLENIYILLLVTFF